jgi:hypothetical protein
VGLGEREEGGEEGFGGVGVGRVGGHLWGMGAGGDRGMAL